MQKGSIILACLVAACLAGASSAGAGEIQTGILDPWALGGADGDLSAERVKQAGATAVRLQLTWRDVAPEPPADPTNPCSPQYRWGGFDALLRRVDVQGLVPVVYILSAPDWAEGAGSGPAGTVKPDRYKLAQFAEAAARRYNGDECGVLAPDVRYWQLWNEPNLSGYLNPQFDSKGRPYSPVHYRRMLNSFAAAVHGVNTANVVIAGGTGAYGGDKNRVRPLAFMRKMLCLSTKLTANCRAKSRFDIWSTHPYTHGAPTRQALHPDDVAMGDLADMRRVLRAGVREKRILDYAGIPKKALPFWITEISWDTRPPDTKGVPLKLHARWTSEALYRMWRARVSRAFWFMLRDRPLPTERWQSGFYFCGAATRADDGECGAASLADDAVKSRSLRAFRFPFVAFAGNGRVSVWGRIPPDRLGATHVAIQRRTSRGWKIVAWPRVRGGGIFKQRWRASWTKGSLRARIPETESSVPFSLKRPSSSKRFLAFGCGGNIPC